MYSIKNVAIFLAVSCSHFKHVHDCLTVQIFPVIGQHSQGKGYLLVGDVSSWRCFCSIYKFFVKRKKNRECSSVWLVYQCISNAMCYYTRRSPLTWLVLHRGKNMQCYAVLCGILYSIHKNYIHNSVEFHLFYT